MKYTAAAIDADLRRRVFLDAIFAENDEVTWEKINDRQYGCILTDMNGVERYIRLGAIVTELREGETARERMDAEIADYNAKQAAKAARAAARAEKAAKDKAKREAAKQAKGE